MKKKLKLSKETLYAIGGHEPLSGVSKTHICPQEPVGTNTSCTREGSGQGCCSFPVGCE